MAHLPGQFGHQYSGVVLSRTRRRQRWLATSHVTDEEGSVIRQTSYLSLALLPLCMLVMSSLVKLCSSKFYVLCSSPWSWLLCLSSVFASCPTITRSFPYSEKVWFTVQCQFSLISIYLTFLGLKKREKFCDISLYRTPEFYSRPIMTKRTDRPAFLLAKVLLWLEK